ncbi:PH domain-containing protein [Hydrogenobaculum acidophilum]
MEQQHSILSLAFGILIVYWLLTAIVSIIKIKIGDKQKLIQKYLTGDEHIVVEGEMVYIKEIITSIIVGAIGIAISIFVFVVKKEFSDFIITFLYAISLSLSILVKPYVLKKTTKLLITSKRLILAYGTWGNNVIDYSLDKISNIVLKQSLWGRIFGFAKIAIISTSGAELKIWNRELELKNAEEFIKAFVSMRT